MRKKIFVSIASITLLWIVWAAGAIQAYVPKDEPVDPNYKIPDEHMDVVTWKTPITDIISQVNSYLWFAIGFVCFLFMIWNGYQLIMARGDEKQMKTATSSIIWAALWLVVSLLAYIIVNIAVKFFQ